MRGFTLNLPMPFFSRLLLLVLGALTGLAVAGCNSGTAFPKDFKPVIVQFNLETPNADPGSATSLPLSGQRIAYDPAPVLNETDLIGVKIEHTQMGSCTIFSLTPDATRKFYLTSAAHQGLRLVVTLNGVPTGVIQITQPVGTGTLPVYLELSDTDLPELVNRMNATCVEIQKGLR
jgi:hypothetical protein